MKELAINVVKCLSVNNTGELVKHQLTRRELNLHLSKGEKRGTRELQPGQSDTEAWEETEQIVKICTLKIVH